MRAKLGIYLASLFVPSIQFELVENTPLAERNLLIKSFCRRVLIKLQSLFVNCNHIVYFAAFMNFQPPRREKLEMMPAVDSREKRQDDFSDASRKSKQTRIKIGQSGDNVEI